MNSSEYCLNCQQLMHGPICSHCGQSIAKPIETFRVVNDIREQFFELDFRFVRAIRDILLRPSEMILQYLAGKRIDYTNPFKFLFLIATAYFLIAIFLDINISGYSQKGQDYSKTLAAFLNYFLFLFLVPTALLFKYIFKKLNMNWAESYVVVCYLWSGYLLLTITLFGFMTIDDSYFFLARVLVGIIYFTSATKNMCKISGSKALMKSTFLYIGYMASTFLIMGLFIFLSHLIGFKPLML